MSDKRLFELFQRLRNEESAKSIAARIQKTWGINPNSTVHSISQGILKFKKRIAHLILTVSSPATGNSIPDNSDTINRLDALEGMERVALLQRERIERMMLEERDLGIKHSNLSRDLQSLATLPKIIMYQKEFDIKHENDDPVKRRKLEQLEQNIAKDFDRFIKEIIPTKEDKEKVMKATSRFIELIDERSVKIDLETPIGK